MDGRIFINYGRADMAYVQRLDGYLREHDLEPFVSYAYSPGPELARALIDQVDQIAAVVVVVTPDACRSSWIKRAIEYSLYHNKPVVPLLLGGAPHPLLVNHHHENVHQGQMPSAILVERLRSLVREVGSGRDVEETMPLARAYGQIVDMRDRLGATFTWSLLLAVAAVLGWTATGHWSETLQARYGAAAGMAILIISLAVALRLPRIATGAWWASVTIGAFLAAAAAVLAWRVSVQHLEIGWGPPAAALMGAVAWPFSGRKLSKVISGEARIKILARIHELVRQRAARRFWLSAGEPPSVFGRVLTDHVRGVRTPDSHFRYALAASTSVVFVDTSGQTAQPSFTAKATELAAWTRGVRGRLNRSINVSASFVAIDDKVPTVAVTTVGDVDILRVSTEKFARTVAPLLERGYPWLYLPLIVALLGRTPSLRWWQRWYFRARVWLGFGIPGQG